VKLEAATDGVNIISKDLNIKGEANEYFTISNLKPGQTEISIDAKDALAVITMPM